jgi:hypothetical protein
MAKFPALIYYEGGAQVMKTAVTVLGGLLMLILSTGGAPAADQVFEVALKTGDVFKVCKSGLITCPVIISICDDPNVVTTVDTTDGLGFKAVSPGTTLCSAGSGVGPRRFFRFLVR